MRLKRVMIAACCAISVVSGSLLAQAEMTSALKAKVDARLKEYQAWGSDPQVIAAVKEATVSPSPEAKGMNQEKWKDLTLISPEVKSFVKNKLSLYLKEKKGPEVSELFVSAADGTKIAFFSKPTSWSHKGKPKHDVPMSGKTWIGNIEVDESTGVQAVQISIPVLDNGKSIGSIVIGLSIPKL